MSNGKSRRRVFRVGVLLCVSVVLQTVETTEYTEWRLPIYGVHHVMMEKSALAGEGAWGVHAHPLSAFYHHGQSCSLVVVRSYLEGRYTLSVSSLPICTRWSRKRPMLVVKEESKKYQYLALCVNQLMEDGFWYLSVLRTSVSQWNWFPLYTQHSKGEST